MKPRARHRSGMRLAVLLAVLAVAGCLGVGGSVNHVRVRNVTEAPAMMVVVVLDLSMRETEFAHGFQIVQPGQALEVAHSFERGRGYVVNASAVWGDPPREATGERRIDHVPSGGDVEIHLSGAGTLDIRVLVADRGGDGERDRGRRRGARGLGRCHEHGRRGLRGVPGDPPRASA